MNRRGESSAAAGAGSAFMPSAAALAGASVIAIAILNTLTGCERPLQSELPHGVRERLLASVRQEVATIPEDEPDLVTTQPPGEVEQALAARREELETMAGPDSYEGIDPPLSPDLTGRPQTEVAISLEQAIATAVEGNLDVEIARVQRAINAEDVIAAEAAFDAVLYGTADLIKSDEPTAVPVLRGIPLGAAVSVRDTTEYEAGVRRRLIYGTELSVFTRLSRVENKTPGFSLDPNPSYTAGLGVGVSQPLLRGFGADVNLAEVYFAENSARRSIEDLRSNLLDIVATTEEAYWDLVSARREILIRQRLLESGVAVRDVLEARLELDVTPAEYADAVATVERRRAEVIRSTRALRAASDRLKGLLNDAELTVGSEALLMPTDFMTEAPITYNLMDVIVEAVENRPEVDLALLDLRDAQVDVGVTRNLRLPLLNVAAEAEQVGLSGDFGGAYGNVTENTFTNYLLSAIFEYPFGNREAEARYSQALLRRSQAVLGYRRAVQQAVLDVKAALRDVVASYELIQATRSARLAEAENLRTLLIEEELKVGLTPEFLNLKFQRQERLALAELNEIAALAVFNKSVAQLYRAMGTGLRMKGIDFDGGDRERDERM
jgi:outer membrane protein TolC